MSDLGAVFVGFVLGLCGVGAVLLRNEQAVREAWWRWRGMNLEVHPAGQSAIKAKAPIKLGMVVSFGLLTITWVGLAVAASDVSHIVLAALYLVVFCVQVRRYRRSRRAT